MSGIIASKENSMGIADAGESKVRTWRKFYSFEVCEVPGT